jgi:hypothetical protein
MPSKRSRQWHARKAADAVVRNAARRLSGDYVSSTTGNLSGLVRDTSNVKVSLVANGQTIEFESVKEFSLEGREGTGKSSPGDDLALATAYAFAERRKVEEAAARLDGSYVERVSAVPKGWDTDWDQPNPNRTPRLDGRRWKK